MEHRVGVPITIGTPDTEKQLLDVINVSAASYQELKDIFHLPEEVSGLRTLDIGAGASDLTVTLLEQGADAYAVDPRYKNSSDLRGKAKEHVRHLRGHKDIKKALQEEEAIERCLKSIKSRPDHYKAASATNLPFPDDYFNLVISSSAILGYLDVDFRILHKATQEALRVTKSGGTIQFHPYSLRDVGHGEGVLRRRTESLFLWRNWMRSNSAINFRLEPSRQNDKLVILVKK